MTELFYQIKRLITNFAHVFLKKVHTTSNNGLLRTQFCNQQ